VDPGVATSRVRQTGLDEPAGAPGVRPRYGPRRGQPFEKDVLDLGICRVGTSLGGDEPGEPKIEAEGILIADWHAYWPNVEETRVEGFVRRIRTSDLVQVPAPNPMLPWPARRRVWFDMASTKNWVRSDVFIDLIVDSKARSVGAGGCGDEES
jgi:hypothetical protein